MQILQMLTGLGSAFVGEVREFFAAGSGGVDPRDVKVVLTDDTNLAAMYAATVYPIYVAIDRDGNIAATQRGAAGEEALRDLLATAGLEIKTDSDAD